MKVDIVEHQQIQDKFRVLFHAVEQSPCAILITDKNGSIEYVNPKFVQVTGYTSEEAIGKTPRLLKSGEMPSEEYKNLWDTITSGHEWRGEFYNRKKTGEFYWAHASISPIKDSEGSITHFVGIQEDITERKQMELSLEALNESLELRVAERTTELAESEEKFRNISAAAQDAIIMLDNEEKVSFWNNAAENMFDYTKEEVIGKNLHKLIVPEKYRKDHLNGFERFKNTGKGSILRKTIELSALRKDGTAFPIELSLSEVKLKDKWNAIGIIRNITQRKRISERLLAEISEHKRAREKLKRIVTELERSNSELEQFAYVASHDLQEPLRMVSSYTQLLARRYKGKLDADADEFINFAVDGANRMQRLIQDLLEYSRVGTRGKPFKPTDCAVVYDRALVNLHIAVEDSSAVVTHNNLPTVMVDSSQLVQLFQNLIGNAIKFHGKGAPRIHVSAEQKDNDWVFSVSDNGIGIDPQYADRIFVIFQRLHKNTEYSGSGIGLAICKKIVERHGGRIWMESELGKGTTFYFTIPIYKEDG